MTRLPILCTLRLSPDERTRLDNAARDWPVRLSLACPCDVWYDDVDTLAEFFADSRVTFHESCSTNSRCSMHADRAVALALAQQKPSAFASHAVRARTRVITGPSLLYDGFRLGYVKLVDDEVARASLVLWPIMARYAFVDAAIALAPLAWPYLVLRIVVDFAVDGADAVREYVRDCIAIAVHQRAGKLAYD